MSKELSMRRGDTKVYKFQRTGPDGKVIREKAAKIFFTVKRTNLPNEFLLQKTLDNMQFDAEDGTYRLTIDPEDTEGLPFGTYKYDLQVTSDSGAVTTVAFGGFRLMEEVTFKANEGD